MAGRGAVTTRSRTALATAALVIAGALPVMPARAVAPGTDVLGEIGSLGLPIADSVTAATAEPLLLAAGFRPTRSDARVLLISSGVDTSVLPPSLRGRVSFVSDPNLPATAGDQVGLGTYAASVVLQAAPDARVVSARVFSQGRTNPALIWQALRWATENTSSFDVVLLATPPSSFLDPTSAAMATGEWEDVLDAASDDPFFDADGRAIMGIPADPTLLQRKTGASPTHFTSARRFAYISSYWIDARERIRTLTEAGLGVVVPAGDHGPAPQTVLGLGNLPEVVTVGAADAGVPAPSSAAGPSIDHRVKPDLLAPAGVVGLLPGNSQLAAALAGALDGGLAPEWTATDPPGTDARARLATSFSSAAIVAAAMGGMRLEGLDVPMQRGALSAAADPTDAPVWREGAGILSRVPDALFAASRPLALAHGDLGPEPAEGEWSVTVPIANASPSSGTSSLTDHITVDVETGGSAPKVVNVVRTLDASDGHPITATPSGNGVKLSAIPGDGMIGGSYCGTTTLTVPLSSEDIEIPVCLMEGTKVKASAHAIHMQWAEHSSFGLFPTMPPGATLLTKPLDTLHLNPLEHVMLFGKSTDQNGDAVFHNIPPGYYKVKLFADYGTPITQRLDEIRGPETVETTQPAKEAGSRIAYQAFSALILPPNPEAVCSASPNPNGPDHPCDYRLLRDTLGEPVDETTDGSEDELFVWENSTWTYGIGPVLPTEERFRLIKGCDKVDDDGKTGDDVAVEKRDPYATCFKKSIGAAVTSRYIDLVNGDDLATWSVEKLTSVNPVDLRLGGGSPVGDGAWRFEVATGEQTRLEASYDEARAAATATGFGVMAYPFNLTTPNYSAHVSLNFTYQLQNAFAVAIVQIGHETHWSIIAPNGTFSAFPTTGTAALDVSQGVWGLLGSGSGPANFEIDFLPRGTSEGMIMFILVPARALQTAVGSTVSSISTAAIDDLSFELRTWTPTAWPGRKILSTGEGGHRFHFDSRYGAPRALLDDLVGVTGETFDDAQIGAMPERRVITNGAVQAEVVEDWTVMVHSPSDHARTIELCDPERPPPNGVSGDPYCGATTRPAGTIEAAAGLRITRDELMPADDDPLLHRMGQRAALYDPYDPDDPIFEGKHPLLFLGAIDDVWEKVGRSLPVLRSNRLFFEVLKIPHRVLRAHDRRIEIHIADLDTGRRRGTSAPDLGSFGEDTPGPGARVPHVCGPAGEDDCRWDEGIVSQPGAAVELAPYVPFTRPPQNTGWVGKPESGWSSWESLGGIAVGSPDVTSWGVGHLDEFVRGTDQPTQIWWRRYLSSSGSWTQWTGLGQPPGGVISSPGAASPSLGRTDVYVTGQDKSLWRKRFRDGVWSSTWEPVGVPCGATGCGVGFASGPDAAATADGRVHVAARDLNGVLWLRATDGAGGWGGWVSLGAPSGGMVGDPSVAATGDKIWVFARSGGAGGRIWYRSFADGSWTGWRDAGGPLGGAQGSPDAVAREGGLADVFVRGPGNVLWSVRWLGDRWSHWYALDGKLLEDPSVTSWGPARLDVVIGGTDRQVWHRSWEPDGDIVPVPIGETHPIGGTWSDVWSLGGIADSAPDITSWGAGHMEAFVRGTDRPEQIWHRRWSDATGQWTGWFGLGAPPVGLDSAPAAAGMSQRIDLFVKGDDGSMWRRRFAGSAWASWDLIGRPCEGLLGCHALRSGPDASARDGRVDVVAVADDAKVWLVSSVDAGATFGSWTSLGAPPASITGDPTITSWGSGRLDVFVTGIDGELWHRARAAGTWGAWTRVGAPPNGIASGPEAAAPSEGVLDVFARGANQELWRVRSVAGGWSAWTKVSGKVTFAPSVVSRTPGTLELLVSDDWARLAHRHWSP